MRHVVRHRAILIIASLVLLALATAGCSGPATVVPASGALVTVELRGGECPAGTCSTVVVLERDGRVRQAAKPPNVLGVVDPARVAAVEAAIRATDFTAMRSHPFTGGCPTAWDGQEVVYEFATAAGTERLVTCEVDIDYGAPLFAAVSAALGPFVALPTT